MINLELKYKPDVWKMLIAGALLIGQDETLVEQVLDRFFVRYPDPLTAGFGACSAMKCHLVPLGKEMDTAIMIREMSQIFMINQQRRADEQN